MDGVDLLGWPCSLGPRYGLTTPLNMPLNMFPGTGRPSILTPIGVVEGIDHVYPHLLISYPLVSLLQLLYLLLQSVVLLDCLLWLLFFLGIDPRTYELVCGHAFDGAFGIVDIFLH